MREWIDAGAYTPVTTDSCTPQQQEAAVARYAARAAQAAEAQVFRVAGSPNFSLQERYPVGCYELDQTLEVEDDSVPPAAVTHRQQQRRQQAQEPSERPARQKRRGAASRQIRAAVPQQPRNLMPLPPPPWKRSPTEPPRRTRRMQQVLSPAAIQEPLQIRARAPLPARDLGARGRRQQRRAQWTLCRTSR